MTAVAEVTIRLDQLDGTLATVFGRRLALHADAEADALRAWSKLAARIDVNALVRRYRAGAGIGEARYEDDDEAIGTAAALDAEQDQDNGDDSALYAAFLLALRRGRAEGVAGAVALAAARTGRTVDAQAVYDVAYDALAVEAARLSADATRMLRDVISGVASQIGRLLARLAQEGASRDEMAARVRELLTSPDPGPVRFVADLGVSRAMSQGALDFYGAAGLRTCDFITAGDTRVCPTCEDIEAGNPYDIHGAPAPGIHGNCRCILVPNEDIPSEYIDSYAEPGGGF